MQQAAQLGRQFQAAEAERARQLQALEAERAQRQELGRILSGQQTPAFLRPGGAEYDPQQFQQGILTQLGALGTPEAIDVLTQIRPKIETPAERSRRELEEKKQALQERKFEQEVRAFETELTKPQIDQEEVFKRETKIRSEFTDLSKDYIKQRDAFGRVQASSTDPSAAGDLALIFNFMKVLDPGSVVREGEFATAQNAAGVPERVRAQYNQVFSGERLSDKTREDFVNRANKLFESADKQHNKRVQQYTKLSERLGLSPENILLDLSLANEGAQREEQVEVGQQLDIASPQFTPEQIQAELRRRGLQ
jgi:hypothetical protein